MKRIFILMMIMGFTSISAFSSDNDSIHIFNSGDTISSSQMNFNFQFLAKQFKTNQKVINCPSDSISKAIEDGYNHLIINGTCQFTPLISPFHLSDFEQYGFSFTKPTTHLTFEGGTNEILEKDPSAFGMLIFGGSLLIKNMTISQNIYASLSARVNISNSTIIKINSQQSSSVDLYNTIINCVDNDCIFVNGSSDLRGENLTIINS